MISILQRYIAKSVLISTMLVILVVSGLGFFINLLGELKDIGIGDYGFTQALLHTVLLMPYTLYQFFPMLVLVGGVMGLGVLASNRELIVMRTSGVSIVRILTAVLCAAFFLIVFATVVGEYLAPHANYIANKRKDSAQSGGQAVATASGVWVHEGNNFLHIEKVNGLEHLSGVTRYEFNAQHQLLATYYAKNVDYVARGEWQLHNVVKTTFVGDKAVSQQSANGVWSLSLNPNLLNVGIVAPEEMSLPRLLKYSKHLVENKTQASSFQFEFWKRVIQPLMTLVMILLAVPFVFAAPRVKTMGWRIVFGVMVGFIFYLLNAMLGQVSVVYDISPFFAAILPTVVFAIIGYVLLMRVRV